MNNERIEKKFVLGKHEEDNLEKILITNGFKKHYFPRQINSLYLDTLKFNFAKDNIDGVSERKKIRFRWYNDNYDNIFLEEKKKRSFLVSKNVKKVSEKFSKKNIIYDLKNYFDNRSNMFNNYNYKLVLLTKYFRSYWISHDKKIRATIDKNLQTSAANKPYKFFQLNETILEFKFSPYNEKYFRNLFYTKNLNLRSKKFSKYLQSFELLENSGLII